jgi:hypothetical protein
MSYILHPTPFALHPHILHPTPILQPTPYILHPTPYALQQLLNPTARTQNNLKPDP